jgi:hypothetical protein
VLRYTSDATEMITFDRSFARAADRARCVPPVRVLVEEG